LLDLLPIARIDLRALGGALTGREEGPGVLAIGPVVDRHSYRLLFEAAGGWPDEVIVAENRAWLRHHGQVTGEVAVASTVLRRQALDEVAWRQACWRVTVALRQRCVRGAPRGQRRLTPCPGPPATRLPVARGLPRHSGVPVSPQTC
jgi:hypothetical protein